MVVEEKYMTQQDIPALQAIGWEGLYLVLYFSHNISVIYRRDSKTNSKTLRTIWFNL